MEEIKISFESLDSEDVHSDITDRIDTGRLAERCFNGKGIAIEYFRFLEDIKKYGRDKAPVYPGNAVKGLSLNISYNKKEREFVRHKTVKRETTTKGENMERNMLDECNIQDVNTFKKIRDIYDAIGGPFLSTYTDMADILGVSYKVLNKRLNVLRPLGFIYTGNYTNGKVVFSITSEYDFNTHNKLSRNELEDLNISIEMGNVVEYAMEHNIQIKLINSKLAEELK